MGNISNIISQHNKKVIQGGQNQPARCQCENHQCPVGGNCTTEGVVYQATVTQNGTTSDTYIGLTERQFINRYRKHYTNFESRNAKNSTKLSKKIWKLQDQQKNYEINWEIIRKVKPYNAGNSECGFCLMWIYIILFQPEKA